MIRTILTVLTFSVAARASVITFTTPTGATESGGNPVNASATFSILSANTLTITLSDLLVNPTTVAQNLSDLSFLLSTGQTTGTLTSSSATERTVAANGTFTDGATVATGWVLQSGFTLCDLCAGAAGPAHTIIGAPNASNVYSNANNSIAGNGPHNPFLGTATFTLNIPGITTTTTVTSATFSFGTTEGDTVPGVPGVPVPEPISSALVGTGLISLFFLRRRILRP